jgi:hypothetical protein
VLSSGFRKYVCCCLRVSKLKQRQRGLYEKALRKIDHELDIRHISRELQTLRFITKILLTKYQRLMIPYFKQHLLNYEDQKEPDSLAVIEDGLARTIDSSLQSKLDRRVLKNIDQSFDQVPALLEKL